MSVNLLRTVFYVYILSFVWSKLLYIYIRRDWWEADYSGLDTWKGWRITDYRRERQSYVSSVKRRTVLREMWGRQERRKTGRRRQETEEGGKDYQIRRWKSCGQHLTPDKGKRGRERDMCPCSKCPIVIQTPFPTFLTAFSMFRSTVWLRLFGLR